MEVAPNKELADTLASVVPVTDAASTVLLAGTLASTAASVDTDSTVVLANASASVAVDTVSEVSLVVGLGVALCSRLRTESFEREAASAMSEMSVISGLTSTAADD